MAILPDVEWDFAAAEAAVSLLRQSADQLDAANYRRAHLSQETTLEWRGPQRLEFDDRLEQTLRRAIRIAGEFRHAAEQIAAANQRCYEEQRYRESRRGY
jgi:hypothetical protein